MTTEATPAPERTPFHDAELYDVLFSSLDFDREFYVGLAREAGGPVLEVTCGTGRILLPSLQAGADIDGLDLFPEMLAVLRGKAAALGLAPPRVYEADMRDFTLPRRYALITIPFNGFVHNLTTEDQLQTLRACRKHLAHGGVLVFNIFFPGREILNGPEGVPVLEHEAPHPATGLPVRIYDTRSLDLVAQIQTSHIEIQELDADGGVTASHPSTTTMRWTYKPEMELLLQAAGFPRWQICGDFDRRPLVRDTDQMVVFAWKD
jgi:SAM-dependent methyltransferase